MRREGAAACVVVAAMLATGIAGAQDAGKLDASARTSAIDAGAMPTGHPDVSDADAGAATRDPHGAGGTGRGGMFEPKPDGVIEDPTIPPGTIEVHVADPDGAPLANADVTLGMLYSSVAKGESRKRVAKSADSLGKARFDSLETGSGVAYRAMVFKDGATFAVAPFQLPATSGMRAVLHVYPVTSNVEESLVVSQVMLYTEVKDDRVQVQQAFKFYNFGRTAWVPSDLVVPMPPELTAFATQQGMTDVGVDAVPGRGVRLRGTFGPGQHVVEFRWQLPYSGERDVRFEVGMPPHVASARVIAPASREVSLDVDGFPAPQPTSDGAGQRVLVTEKQLRREEGSLDSLRLAIRGLPTTGPGRLVATFLAAGGIALGLVLGTRRARPSDRKHERAPLLAELEALERGREAGDVGPKTYERARRELLDDLARTFAGAEDAPPARKRRAS